MTPLVLMLQLHSAAAETLPIQFQVSDGLLSGLESPWGWVAYLSPAFEDSSAQLTLSPSDYALRMDLSLMPVKPGEPPQDLDAAVEKIGRMKLDQSVEREVVLRRFQNDSAEGSYATFTDSALADSSAVPDAAWRHMTVGTMRTGELVVGMLLYSNSLVSEDYQSALGAWLSLRDLGKKGSERNLYLVPSMTGGSAFSFHAPPLSVFDQSWEDGQYKLTGALMEGFTLTVHAQTVGQGEASSKVCFEELSSAFIAGLADNRRASLDPSTSETSELAEFVRWDHELLVRTRPWKRERIPQAWFVHGAGSECFMVQVGEHPAGPQTQTLFSEIEASISFVAP